jgi:hypothetical protein
MTTPFERTRALILSREFLRQRQDPKQTPRVPARMRDHAKSLLKDFPSYNDIEQAHQAVPEVYGPVPPFSRPRGTADVQGVIDATKQLP